MIKNGKPFCYRYKRKLIQEEQKVEKKEDDKDINSLFINCVYKNSDNDNNQQPVTWLGDTGAQCHIVVTDEMCNGSNKLSVTMGNASTLSVLQRKDVIIEDDLGSTMTLYDVHIVDGMNTNIISILQLYLFRFYRTQQSKKSLFSNCKY